MREGDHLWRPRGLWLIPLGILMVAYLLVNTSYTLFPSRLNETRPLLAIWVIGAAVALPALLGARRLQPSQVLLLGWASVAAVLYFVPVWHGHGCWSPDLTSLIGMLALGGLAAAGAAVGRLGPRAASGDRRRVTAIALVVVLAFGGTALWAAPRKVSLLALAVEDLAEGAGTPSVVWQTSLWGEVSPRLAPVMWRQRVAGSTHLALGAEGGRMVSIVAYNRAIVSDAATGRMLADLRLAGSEQGANMDRQYSQWQGIELSGDLCAVLGGYWVDVYSVSSGTHLSRIAGAKELLQLSREQIVVDAYGWLQAYTAEGTLLWDAKPPQFAGEYPQTPDPKTPYGISGYGRIRLAAKTAHGWVVGGVGGVKAVDDAGAEQWSYVTGEVFCGLAAHPGSDIVYLATMGPDGARPLLRAIRAGREVWRFRLPEGVLWYEWAVLPEGLALLHQQYGSQGDAGDRDTRVLLLRAEDGQAIWETELPTTYLASVVAIDGGLVVVGDSLVLRIGPVDGEVRWRHTGDRPYETGSSLVFRGAPLVFRTYEGLLALDPLTGETLWRARMVAGRREFFESEGVLFTVTQYGAVAIAP